MNYYLNRNGQDLGSFSLEELQRRRAAGELDGTEQVCAEGAAGWQPLGAVLSPVPLSPKALPSPVPQKPKENQIWIVVLLLAGLFLTTALVGGLVAYRMWLSPALKQLAAGSSVRLSAMEAASQPVLTDSNSLTAADVIKVAREFRMRQYIDGYRLRGERNPECDALALGMVSNWIACNYDGNVDTNLPPLSELADRLANDPACTDPLILTVAAVNTVELHEVVRRLERAVKGFENSRHLGYPKMWATESLAEKLINDRTDRLPVLDAQALQYFQEALTDGSLRSEDQAEIADVFVFGWAAPFFSRNAAPVCSLVQQQGEKFRWLALVLQGDHEIAAAWQARGDGYSDTVSQSGWEGFSQHLASARNCFTEAWKLKPNLPLAPCRMMTVCLGEGGIGEMRLWFDRTVAAQFDYGHAWDEMRWGLRPRWYGDTNAMLAFGVTALNTRRFDTDVPRKFFDSISDVESELKLPPGRHIFGDKDIWPHLKDMYEGYLAFPRQTAWSRDGWHSTYAVIAYLAGKNDVAREQLQSLNWQPHPWNLTGWARDLTAMPLEVAARTGPQSTAVAAAEASRQAGDIASALKQYDELAATTKLDALTRSFVQERQYTLGVEKRLQAGEWVRFLPTDAAFTGWYTNRGSCQLLPDGTLEVKADENGHMLYSRARVGTDFEVRGQFEVVNSTDSAFQAGLVMGIPQIETYNWYAFRIKRNRDEGDVASFSQHWIKRQILAPINNLDSRTNSFDFRFQGGRVSAAVNGREVFQAVEPPRNSSVTTNEFLLGLGAFNDSNSSVIRYHDIEVRSLAAK